MGQRTHDGPASTAATWDDTGPEHQSPALPIHSPVCGEGQGQERMQYRLVWGTVDSKLHNEPERNQAREDVDTPPQGTVFVMLLPSSQL